MVVFVFFSSDSTSTRVVRVRSMLVILSLSSATMVRTFLFSGEVPRCRCWSHLLRRLLRSSFSYLSASFISSYGCRSLLPRSRECRVSSRTPYTKAETAMSLTSSAKALLISMLPDFFSAAFRARRKTPSKRWMYSRVDSSRRCLHARRLSTTSLYFVSVLYFLRRHLLTSLQVLALWDRTVS